ncbi:MAG: PQQ-binding-like beta-propeller repeat protein [Ignavibacteriaceae bacterium]
MKKIFILFLFLTSTVFSQSTFKFAWLSDIHIGYPTAEVDLEKSVTDINSIDDVKFTIISGDITAIGSLEELSIAKGILDQLEQPYYIIPGNHDCKWSESGSTDFIKLWGDDRFVFEYDKYLFIGLHQGPRMRMADGYWAPEDISWLDSVLASLSDSNQPLIFITHYPLDEGIANWFEVLDRLKNYNTQVVLVGHGHRNRVYDFESIPGVMGRSNLSSDDETSGFTIAEVRKDSIFFYEKNPADDMKYLEQIPLKQRNYEAYVEELPRPDYSINRNYPEVKEVWSFNTGYTIGSSAAIYQDNVIFGNASGKIYSVDIDDGYINWTYQTNGPIYSTPLVTNNSVIFGSSDNSVYCLNADNGILIWKFKTNAAVLGSAVIEDNIIFIGGSDKVFRAVNVNDGNLIWQFDGLNGFIETKPVIYKDYILFGAWDEHFYCLDKNSGELKWKWKGERSGVLYSPAVCHPVVNDGIVFFASPDRTLNAVEINSGKTLWRTGKYEVRETIGISNDGEKIFTRTMNDSIIALPSSHKLEDPVWITNAGFGYDISSAQIIEKDGTIFYPTKTGELYSLNSNNGEILWIHKLSNGYINTVTPISSEKIITTGFDGMIKLVSVEE